jgi:wyosine [tRNA(Phe)-imidazoG37] synthetase (radical SAM superfamily)
MNNNYYCSQKFWWLSIEPERHNIQSCCSAYPSKININWLEQNPGQMFNAPVLIQERQSMLNNQPVSTCEDTCWKVERAGIPSRRKIMNSDVITHTELQSSPEVLHINLGSDCNLTCAYCAKQFSTAWLRDIKNNGMYFDDDRFRINSHDAIVLNLGQKEIKSSKGYQLILKESFTYKNLKETIITGGEPFLYNGLVELLQNLSQNSSTPVRVITGLGVDTKRLQNITKQIPSDNIEFTISAESTGELYEFVRYGNSYEKFLRNLDILKDKYKITFSSVLSNLTIHGYQEFEETWKDFHIRPLFCSSPDYLNVNVLDPESKKILQDQSFRFFDADIKKSLNADCPTELKNKLKTFLPEYARRRNLNLNVLPTNFIKWINE